MILESSAVPDDFSVAFMSIPLHDKEFIKPPIEAESDSRYVWKLRKALNGLKKGISIVFTLIGRRLSLEYLDLWLCVFFCVSAQYWRRVLCRAI